MLIVTAVFIPFVIFNEYECEMYYRPDYFDGLEDCLLAYRTKSREDYQSFVDESVKHKEIISKVRSLAFYVKLRGIAINLYIS